MPRVRYIQHDGSEQAIELAVGESVMVGAIEHQISGIDADCGGQCICATCHVFVDPAWIDKLTAPETRELEMLNFVEATQANSRLSCQIKMQAALDGLTVRLPKSQH
jgi:ferredoxin, 2Fe-2S